MKALYEEMRPKNAADLAGEAQDHMGYLLKLAGRRSQLCTLITGPSGSGKSTMAAILAAELAGPNPLNTVEINIGAAGGVDFVRTIEDQLRYAAWDGAWRVFIFEEGHNLTAQAQEALLHLTENYPEKVALIFTSTSAAGFRETLRSRMIPVQLERLTGEDLAGLAQKAARKMKFRLGKKRLAELLDFADGNARAMLNAIEVLAAGGPVPSPVYVDEPAPVSASGSAAAQKAWATRRAREAAAT